MQRYIIPPQNIQAHTCRLTGQDAHHIKRVMRFRLGDDIICSDGQGNSYKVKIEEISPDDEVVAHIVEVIDTATELPVEVSIVQALPKGDKMEWILQKGTELGARQFIPFYSKRTIVKYDHKKEKKKLERWRTVIKEAAEQAHRDMLPHLGDMCRLQDLSKIVADVKLVAYEEAAAGGDNTSPFVHALQKMKKGQSIAVIIGPEGGFDQAEIDELNASGFQTISLGKRILRTETAAQYILAAISFYFEQMGGPASWRA